MSPKRTEHSNLRRTMVMAALVVAGEAVFSLPFHVTRYFRPTFLEVFHLSNTELGTAQAAYGVVAMLAYFPGGPLADRFSARLLLTTSLLSTSIGGLFMATAPSLMWMTVLWGFWGLTTILLFWAALIRATREWGGSTDQGKAFGLLDGGRGLFAAWMAFVMSQLFRHAMPEVPELATAIQRMQALRWVIYGYTLTTAVAALCVYLVLPKPSSKTQSADAPPTMEALRNVLGRRSVWLQALIVLTAYVAFKGIDYYSLLAVDAYGMNEVDAADFSALSSWIRPVAALGAGVVADRYRSTKVISGLFLLLLLVYSYVGFTPPDPNARWLLYTQVIAACIGVYGLRGVYFAIFEETAVPLALTGTAVGVISVLGYTPDIFVGPLSGMILDAYPGAQGHQYFLLILAGATAVGLSASLVLQKTPRLPPAIAS